MFLKFQINLFPLEFDTYDFQLDKLFNISLVGYVKYELL